MAKLQWIQAKGGRPTLASGFVQPKWSLAEAQTTFVLALQYHLHYSQELVEIGTLEEFGKGEALGLKTVSCVQAYT